LNGLEHRYARIARRGVIAVDLALIALLAWWTLAPEFSVGRLLWAAIGIAPLLIAVPRLWAGHRRTYKWMTLLVVPYVVFALTETIANPQARPWAMGCSLMAFALFALAIVYLRATPAPASRTES
jgi:uncharacterized membrane protein